MPVAALKQHEELSLHVSRSRDEYPAGPSKRTPRSPLPAGAACQSMNPSVALALKTPRRLRPGPIGEVISAKLPSCAAMIGAWQPGELMALMVALALQVAPPSVLRENPM